MTITAQNARARRAVQPRGFSIQKKIILTLLRSHMQKYIKLYRFNANAKFENEKSIFFLYSEKSENIMDLDPYNLNSFSYLDPI